MRKDYNMVAIDQVEIRHKDDDACKKKITVFDGAYYYISDIEQFDMEDFIEHPKDLINHIIEKLVYDRKSCSHDLCDLFDIILETEKTIRVDGILLEISDLNTKFDPFDRENGMTLWANMGW